MARNLETKRTQAAGTAKALTTTTAWHSYWRLPLRIAEPGKLTTYVYNGDTYAGSVVSCTISGYNRMTKLPEGAQIPGPVVCKRIEQSTADINGSLGFSAVSQGLPRIFTYTYGVFGVATVDGPRTDINDTTTLAYYNSGAVPKTGVVSTITNSLGQVTTFVNYNADGQPLEMIDPNGVTTTITYDWRGRLKTKTIGGEVTTYQYDGVGQLTKVTLPDSSYINYTYDAAHRLTDITDSLGNTIHYTLDAMGNSTKDETKDPLGTLSQQTTRVYDALNRLQTLTGAQQ
jgi:YD repeat-containing protein